MHYFKNNFRLNGGEKSSLLNYRVLRGFLVLLCLLICCLVSLLLPNYINGCGDDQTIWKNFNNSFFFVGGKSVLWIKLWIDNSESPSTCSKVATASLLWGVLLLKPQWSALLLFGVGRHLLYVILFSWACFSQLFCQLCILWLLVPLLDCFKVAPISIIIWVWYYKLNNCGFFSCCGWPDDISVLLGMCQSLWCALKKFMACLCVRPA